MLAHFKPRRFRRWAHTVSAGLLLCVLPIAGQHLPTVAAPQPTLTAAQAHRRAGHPAEALAMLEALLRSDPRNAGAWLELGRLQGELHNFAAAEHSLREAVARAPEDAEAHYLLGLALVADPRNKLDWPGAVAEFRTAVRLRPGYADALTYLGAGLLALGHPEEAVASLRQAVAADPELQAAQFNLGLALAEAGNSAEAKAAYRAALALQPSSPEVESALGKLLARTGDLAGAETELRRALALNPDLQDAEQALGSVLQKTHRSAEAAAALASAAALGQREPDGIAASQKSNAALKLAGEDKLPQAVQLLREAVLLRPDYGPAHYNLGLLLADSGNLPGAREELSLAVSLLPAQGRPWFDLGRVLLLQGDAEKAAACLRWAGLLLPQDERVAAQVRKLSAASVARPLVRPPFGAAAETPLAHSAFAAELYVSGNYAGEAGELLHALQLAPAMMPERLRLAEAYRLLHEPEKAEDELRKALLVEPGKAKADSIR